LSKNKAKDMSTQEKYLNHFVSLDETELAKFNKKDRIAYEDSLKYYRNLHNSLLFSREKGLVKGLEEGEKRKYIEITKNLLSIGLSFENISKGTKLSIEEIKKIADSLEK
jgi:predicted transposase/invertase (TIGR01784 family)